jgi:importin subunit beta-1
VVCHTAAQVLAAYGAVDIPENSWSNLLPALFQNINGASVHETCKVSSLESLGFMLDGMSPENVEPSVVNQMLTCIIEGNRSDRSAEMRLAAITALNNSIEFAAANFEVQNERDALIRAICEATQAKELKIRERAFECFAEVAEFYYSKLQSYVEVLYQLSINAIKNDEPAVGMQAIEFWNTICDQEIALIEDIEDGEAEQSDFLKIMHGAAPGLTPLLLECMTKQEEDLDDEDTWNISMAAATLLESMSKTVGDQIVDLVLPFVTQNINDGNWRLKEAAVMAFGMILEGPSVAKLAPVVTHAMPVLIGCLKDQKPLVRDTSAWTVGRICELYKTSLTAAILPPMVEGLAKALEDSSPKVVSRSCYAVHSLAEACADENEANSNVLSHFMPLMLQKLLAITNKPDWDSENVASAAYEAINKMVENSAADMQEIVLKLLLESLNRLEHTFNPQLNQNERLNVQSSLCGLIGEIIKKLSIDSISPHTDRIMQLLFQVFSTKGAMAHEDAFIAIGYMTSKIGSNFLRYLAYLQAPLITGLKSVEESSLCTVAVGVVGDLCRALSKSIMPYCDDIMHCLLELLQSPVLNRSVKPHVISVFADIAMAIEGDFERYVKIILGILKQAGEVNITTDDEDLIEYINTLRNSILEAYTGILQVEPSSYLCQ